MRTRTARRSTLHHVGLTAFPADPNSQLLRSEQMDDVVERNAAIRRLRTNFPSLSQAWIDSQIDAGADLVTVRAAVLDELVRLQVQTPPQWRQGGPSGDDPAVIRTRAADALAHRLGASGELPEASRQFRGMPLVLQLRHVLNARSEPLAFSMTDAEVITRSITTDDLPILLTETTNRLLLPAYQAAQSPLRRLAQSVTATDFRERFSVRISEAPILLPVAEDGEVTSGPLSESAEPVSVHTEGRIVSTTFQALVNDQLGAFARLPAAFAQSAAESENRAIVNLIVSNSGNGPTMSDTHPLFDATWHNNVGTPAAPTEESIEEAVVMMRQTTGLDGETLISVVPRYLIVPPALEFTARKVLGTVYPATSDNVNPLQDGLLEIMIEPRLTDPDRWYIAANLPTLIFASLSGYEQPQVETRAGWEILGVSTRCVHHFGVGVSDYRGMFKNDGAS